MSMVKIMTGCLCDMHKGQLETGDAPPVQQMTPVNESGVAASQGRESHKGNRNTSFSREILSDGRRSGPAKNLAFFRSNAIFFP